MSAPNAAGEKPNWYYKIASTQHGPVTLDDIVIMYNEGKISADDWVWHPKSLSPEWVQLRYNKDFVEHPEITIRPIDQTTLSPKKEGILGPIILIGIFGLIALIDVYAAVVILIVILILGALGRGIISGIKDEFVNDR